LPGKIDGATDRAVVVGSGLVVGGMRVGVFVRVGSAGHPARALFTAVTSSSTETRPSPSLSTASQSSIGVVPSAMLTARTNSSTVTVPIPSQSPTHELTAAPLWPATTQNKTAAAKVAATRKRRQVVIEALRQASHRSCGQSRVRDEGRGAARRVSKQTIFRGRALAEQILPLVKPGIADHLGAEIAAPRPKTAA
jgi:hypothetical protein